MVRSKSGKGTAIQERNVSEMSNQQEPIVTIVIAEPLDIMRAGLRALLEDETGFEVVGQTGDASTLITLVAEVRPDVMILEPALTGPSSVQLLSESKAIRPRLKVLLLASPQDLPWAVTLLDQGADGCFLKNDRPEEFLRGVHAVAAHEPAVSNTVTRWLLKQLTCTGHSLPADPLTEREREILDLLTAGLSNKEIAQKLYLSVRTVEVHLRNIYSKLGVRSRLGAVTHFMRRTPPGPTNSTI